MRAVISITKRRASGRRDWQRSADVAELPPEGRFPDDANHAEA